MEYVTFYDVTQAGYRHWWFPVIGLVTMAVAVGKIRYKWRLVGHPVLLLILSAIWTAVAFLSTYLDFRRLSSTLEAGRCEVVAGKITGFQVLPPIGRQKSEEFVVAGTRFQYSGYETRAGFNQMHSRGGPIRESLLVRVHHLHGEIARLEIAVVTM